MFEWLTIGLILVNINPKGSNGLLWLVMAATVVNTGFRCFGNSSANHVRVKRSQFVMTNSQLTIVNQQLIHLLL